MTLKFLTPKNSIEIYDIDHQENEGVHFSNTGISAGFPSPAEDHMNGKISLDNEIVRNKEATFYARVSGQSMIGAGLDDGDLLVIDRSLEPINNKIAVCFIDGEFTVKRLVVSPQEVYLKAENPKYPNIPISEENNFIIWGIVTHVIKKV
jgi:DNA polymerase V